VKLGSLCSGYGGLELGVAQVLDVDVVWHAENDRSAATVLDTHYPDIPNHGDITATDWTAVEPVDVLCAGFPCQPVSKAGQRKVTNDDRWLWDHVADCVRLLRPGHVVLENVSGLLTPWRDGRWWRPAPVEAVLGDLAALGYDAVWRSVRAADVGAPHRRERVFILAADTGGAGLEGQLRLHAPSGEGEAAALHQGVAADTEPLRREGAGAAPRSGPSLRCPSAASAEPDHQGVAADAECGGQSTRARVDVGPPQGDIQAGADPDGLGGTAWGVYAPAIARWEAASGRRAPAPVDERGRLSAVFVEWMMGLPEGWVTATGIARSRQIEVLGNGVVPQQAAYAVGSMVERMVTG
jgi:DNA (cytosine-5)-methyltransferase 1